jgi:hypothetical protein
MAFGVMAGSPAFALTNLGSSASAVFEGNDITPDLGGSRVLYAPSESDDAGYRAALAAQIGGSCDYFDARFSTPSTSFMHDNYDCVMTWANYAYFDNNAFGNNLADFVDQGGHVVLGAFAAYTSGNFLSGRIMSDPAYCPVAGGLNHFSLSFWDGSDPDCCVHSGITSYGTTYRDYLTLDGPGATICGRYQDGEIANAVNAAENVVYANGAGGYPLFPSGQDAARCGNACNMDCGPSAAEAKTWGAVKNLYQ